MTYEWRRDGKLVDVQDGTYVVGQRDSGSRLTCTAVVTFPSGAKVRYTAPPVIVNGTTRLGGLNATMSKTRGPLVTFAVNKAHLVIVQIWCRAKTTACKRPAGPVKVVAPARASRAPVGRMMYRRITLTAKPGTNTVAINDYLPEGLPAGDYKVTVRLAQRAKTGRMTTMNFTSQELTIPKTQLGCHTAKARAGAEAPAGVAYAAARCPTSATATSPQRSKSSPTCTNSTAP